MSSREVKTKHPSAVLDYDVDLASWLPDGDTVIQAGVEITGGTVQCTQVTVSNAAVRVWLSGGEEGEINTITVTVTTDEGRVKPFPFQLRISTR
jgi:hypothetical protein